ncbi:MAG: ABC transporter substrate-binding protein, partial [Chloroflexota bacterium]|nr:ABC transporter substrate-binding protein [Chloroflexota bacterium]
MSSTMHYFMSHVYKRRSKRSLSLLFSVLSSLLLLLAACGSSGTAVSSSHNAKPAAKQILKFPDVGTNDVATLDPAMDPDTNSAIPVGMLYTGLVKTDQALNVVPDQATWQISSDNKVYTFAINPAAAFSDGTPVTAQAYIYTWTRALLPSLGSPLAATLEAPTIG